MENRVVITGIGPIGSVGIGKDAFLQGIIEQKTNVELVKEFVGNDLWDEFYVHKVQDFNLKNFGIDSAQLDFIEDWKESSIDFDLQYQLAATKLAFDDSKIDYNNIQDKRISLIVSNENACMEDFCYKFLSEAYLKNNSSNLINKKEFFNEIYFKIVKSGYEVQTFMPLFHIARVFNIHNYSLFVNNACASGLYAIEAASDIIKLKKASIVVVSCGDHSNILKHLWFKMIDMYESDGKIKPFSRNAKGLVMGEGACSFILEDYEHAIKRGAHIYAEYLGGGFRLEGWKITKPQIGERSLHETIEDALINSKLKKEEIDLLCLHGFGNLVGDFYEAKAIMDLFGSNQSVTALKPYVGHNLGGCTLLELSILLLGMENNFIPPILNTKDVNQKINLDLVLESRKQKIVTVMKTCSAFAGFNAAAVFKKIS